MVRSKAPRKSQDAPPPGLDSPSDQQVQRLDSLAAEVGKLRDRVNAIESLFDNRGNEINFLERIRRIENLLLIADFETLGKVDDLITKVRSRDEPSMEDDRTFKNLDNILAVMKDEDRVASPVVQGSAGLSCAQANGIHAKGQPLFGLKLGDDVGWILCDEDIGAGCHGVITCISEDWVTV